jgi:hypothetical protein
MTEPQSPPEAEQQIVEETQQPEPLYGVEDVQRALSTSGERAMASSYFNTYTQATAQKGLTAHQAQDMVTAIQTGQPWPGENQVNPLTEEGQRAMNPPPEGPPPEGTQIVPETQVQPTGEAGPTAEGGA